MPPGREAADLRIGNSFCRVICRRGGRSRTARNRGPGVTRCLHRIMRLHGLNGRATFMSRVREANDKLLERERNRGHVCVIPDKVGFSELLLCTGAGSGFEEMTKAFCSLI